MSERGRTPPMPVHPVKSLVCIHCGAESFCPKCDEPPAADGPGESAELAVIRSYLAALCPECSHTPAFAPAMEHCGNDCHDPYREVPSERERG